MLIVLVAVLTGVGFGIFFLVKTLSKPKHPAPQQYPPHVPHQQYGQQPPQYPSQQQTYPPQGWGS